MIVRNSKGQFVKGYTIENDTRNHSKYPRQKQIEADNKYYPYYNIGLTDKEIAKETNSGLTAVQSWRWRRSLKPNHPENMNGRNMDGTFKQKRIKGSRDIYTHARDGLKEWKTKILSNCGFKCKICGSSDNLEVHHNKETYLNILDKFLPNRDLESTLTWEEKKRIAKQIVDYHNDNNVSGIVLCLKCHINVHRNNQFIN